MRVSILALLASLSSVHALATDFCGTVIYVDDGDTEWVQTTTGQKVKIRLAGMDAPEVRHHKTDVDQPYGQEAKGVLSELTIGKTICAHGNTFSYGRPVVTVTQGSLNVNEEVVRRGAAWVDPRYDRGHALAPLEAKAQAEKRGLWSLPEDQQIPPWTWRKAH